MKTCVVCKEDKPMDSFSLHNKAADKKQSSCKDCATAAAKLAYQNSKAKKIAHAKRWAENNPERRSAILHNSNLKIKYGIDRNQYLEMLSDQQGVCAICGTDKPGGKRRFFSVDHCHTTGQVRGLLCNSCNAGIGYLQESEEIMKNAINYLSEVKA